MENDGLELTRKLVENPRISIRRLANELGVSYIALRDRLRKLSHKGLISFTLSVSPLLAGSVAAVVRVHGHRVDDMLSKASRCNRVIAGLKMGEGEAVLVIYGRDKGDIVSVIDVLRNDVDGDVEVDIEYGRLPLDFKVQIRNPHPDCNNTYCNSCLPLLRNRNGGRNT